MTDADKQKIIRLEHLDEFLTQLQNTLYTKPSTGIPATDLTQAVQTSLGKADSALQASDIVQLQSDVAALQALVSDGENATAAIDKFNEIVAFLANIQNTQTLEGIVSGINSSIAAKYTKPSTGIPATDLAQGVQDSLALADSALQSHQDISGKVDKVTGKGLSANDYSDADKAKVDALTYATIADIQALFA